MNKEALDLYIEILKLQQMLEEIAKMLKEEEIKKFL